MQKLIVYDAVLNYASTVPNLFFREKALWKIKLENVPDLTQITSFSAAIDTDFDSSTGVMCRTLSGITISGDTVSVPLDAYTARFQSVVNGKSSVKAFFQLQGYTQAGQMALLISFPIAACSLVDQNSSDSLPDAPAGGGNAVTSVNDKTGEVELTASDVGAIANPSGGTAGQVLTKSANGAVWQDASGGNQPIITVTATSGIVSITPQSNNIYAYTAVSGDVFAIVTSALTSSYAVTFELWITQPSTAVSFTLPSGIKWGDGSEFSSSQSAPTLSTANTLYCLVFRWDGSQLLGNLAYSEVIA